MASTTKILLSDFAPGLKHVPSKYVRNISDRPTVIESADESIPLIDLQDLTSPNRSELIKKIGHACQSYGFFQIKNHGVPESVISNMLNIAKEFFQQSESERMKNYSNDPSKNNRLSTSFNTETEIVANWRDYLRLVCYPLDKYVPEWPSNPTNFKKFVAEYCINVKELALKLIEAISESLGLEKDYMDKALNKHDQSMLINFYPPCPEPYLAVGISSHCDPNAVIVLLQDDVPGLQVLNDGKWIAVNPIPNTFIINIGDQMQALSNGRYRSVLHRAVVNYDEDRISIPTFYSPSYDAVIKPAQQLVDEDNHRVYRTYTYGEYYEKFWSRGLATESCLDLFKASDT